MTYITENDHESETLTVPNTYTEIDSIPHLQQKV